MQDKSEGRNKRNDTKGNKKTKCKQRIDVTGHRFNITVGKKKWAKRITREMNRKQRYTSPAEFV